MSIRFLLQPGAGRWFGAVAFLAPVSFLSAIPWLREQPDAVVYLLAGIAATITIMASMGLAVIKDNQMDEWHRSAARFSSQWGWQVGAGLVVLVLALPPVHGVITRVATAFADGADVDPTAALMTFMFGFMTVVIAQTLCTLLLSFIWRRRMSRPSEPDQ